MGRESDKITLYVSVLSFFY